jgi:hypothetical protein
LKKILAVFLLFLVSQKISAQSDSLELIVERIVEFYIETNELSDFDNNTAFEKLMDIGQKKLDLNKVTREDLEELLFLSAIEINSIIDHRSQFGDFILLEELQSVPFLGLSSIKNLINFVSIGDDQSYDLSGLYEAGKHQLFLKTRRVLNQKSGYAPDKNGKVAYEGDPNYLYLRHRFDSGRKLKFGFTAEKDAGEAFFSRSQKTGFDFYSAYVYFEGLHPRIKALSIGDYNINFGQGLILNNGFGFGKSAFVTGIKRGIKALKAYSSVNEAIFYRGAATTINIIPKLDLTVGFSFKKIDGSVDRDSVDDFSFEEFSSINISGLHRTQSEILKKNTVDQRNIASSLAYKSPFGRVAANFLNYQFNVPLIRSSSLYNRNLFNGQTLSLMSLDYDLYLKNVNIFGEAARSDNGGTAIMSGLLMGLDKRLDLALLYRNYSPTYQNLESNAFGESSTANDENGLYLGTELRLTDRWKISGYFDSWSHQWLKFRVDAPSKGFEAFTRLEYNIKRKFNSYLQYRFEQKSRNLSGDESTVRKPVPYQIQKLRWNNIYKVTKAFEVRGRIELSNFQQATTNDLGYIIFGDVIYKPIMRPYSFSTRYGYFSAKNFETRLYAYESDLLYEYSIPAFQDTGHRFYFLGKYKVNRRIGLEARYAITRLTDQETIGSGTEEINGPTRSEIKLQLKFQF